MKSSDKNVELPILAAIADVSAARSKRLMAKLETAFDTRAAFEATHAPANSSIQGKLTSYRKRLIKPGMAALMIAADIDPEFINRETGVKRFNVYGVDKAIDLMSAITTGHIKNAVNLCIVASMFKVIDAGEKFTSGLAQACVSDNMLVKDKKVAALLQRHTAAPSTAPTQASSTMNALVAIGAVKNNASPKFPDWAVVEGSVSTRLREVVTPTAIAA